MEEEFDGFDGNFGEENGREFFFGWTITYFSLKERKKEKKSKKIVLYPPQNEDENAVEMWGVHFHTVKEKVNSVKSPLFLFTFC